jgi:hypothetical protein
MRLAAGVGAESLVRQMETLAGEEPLVIRIGRREVDGEVPRRPLAVSMRTPPSTSQSTARRTDALTCRCST